MSHYVKNRRMILPEAGRIKIGEKGVVSKSQGGNEYQPPKKLDHFKITTSTRGDDGNFEPDIEMQTALEEAHGKPLRKIPVRLLYNDPNLSMPTRYASYSGQVLLCGGDGEKGERLNGDTREATACPCDKVQPGYKGKDKCKLNGVLSVLIDGFGKVGGAHKFRTTSYNTIDGLFGSMVWIAQLSGGRLANIPLMLTLTPKKVQVLGGGQQQVYIVGLEYLGDIKELQQTALQITREETETVLRLERLEEQMRNQPVSDIVPESGPEAEELVEEFYPDAVIIGSEEAEEPTEPSDIFQIFLLDMKEAIQRRNLEIFWHNNQSYLKSLNPTQLESVKYEKDKLLKGENF